MLNKEETKHINDLRKEERKQIDPIFSVYVTAYPIYNKRKIELSGKKHNFTHTFLQKNRVVKPTSKAL